MDSKIAKIMRIFFVVFMLTSGVLTAADILGWMFTGTFYVEQFMNINFDRTTGMDMFRGIIIVFWHVLSLFGTILYTVDN